MTNQTKLETELFILSEVNKCVECRKNFQWKTFFCINLWFLLCEFDSKLTKLIPSVKLCILIAFV